MKVWIGPLLACLAVAFGAFGAHALKDHFIENPAAKEWYQTAVNYHLWHAIAITIAGFMLRGDGGGRWAIRAIRAFFGGIVLFSGSLYLLVFTLNKKFGMITPIGGVLFMLGWIFLAVAIHKYNRYED